MLCLSILPLKRHGRTASQNMVDASDCISEIGSRDVHFKEIPICSDIVSN